MFSVLTTGPRGALIQILRNVVNLAMMDFPVEIVKTQLLKSIDRAPMGDMLKVSHAGTRYLHRPSSAVRVRLIENL